MTSPADNESPNSETNDDVKQSPAYQELMAQYKGLQRKLDKAQKAASRSIASEEQQARLDILNEKLNLVLNSLESDDDERREAFEKFRQREKAITDSVREETSYLQQITNLEIEHDVDFNEFPVAAAHWENGNYKKAVEAFESELKTREVSTPDPEPEPKVKPDAGKGTVAKDIPTRKTELLQRYDEAIAKGDVRASTRILVQLRELESA